MLTLFAIKFIDALSKSITGDTFAFDVESDRSTNIDFAPDNSFVSFICDATILDVSNLKFSPSGNDCALLADVVWNDVSVPLGLVADVVLTVDDIVVSVNSKADIADCMVSNLKFSLAKTATPPTCASPDVPDTDGVLDIETVYESIPMSAIAVCVLFISVSGTLFIWYSSTVSPTACAAASEAPIPLVKLEIVVPDIVPDIISLFTLTCTVPEVGNPVPDAIIKLDDVVVRALVATVVETPDETPVMVTLLLVAYIPWSLWFTFTLVTPFDIVIGFARSFCPYTDVDSPSSFVFASPIILLWSETVELPVVNAALYKVNFLSCDCIASHVLLFCDLNKEPRCGWDDITLFVPETSVSPICEIHIL